MSCQKCHPNTSALGKLQKMVKLEEMIYQTLISDPEIAAPERKLLSLRRGTSYSKRIVMRSFQRWGLTWSYSSNVPCQSIFCLGGNKYDIIITQNKSRFRLLKICPIFMPWFHNSPLKDALSAFVFGVHMINWLNKFIWSDKIFPKQDEQIIIYLAPNIFACKTGK